MSATTWRYLGWIFGASIGAFAGLVLAAIGYGLNKLMGKFDSLLVKRIPTA